MADAPISESRSFNLHSAGTDKVEGSALAIKSASGAIAVDGFTETGTNALVALAIGGGTPHDAVDSGNPIKIGGRASTSPPTAVAAGDRVNAWLDTFGTQQVTLRDTAGAAITTGIQYIEDTALAANAAQGSLVVGRRDDALTTLTPIEGDAVGLRVGDKGALWVQISDGSGAQITSFGGGTQFAEDAALGATPTGTLSMARRIDTLVALTPVADDAISVRVDGRGALWARERPSDTATLSNVASSATSVTLLSANTARLGVTIHNDSTSVAYVKFGTTASATSFNVKMQPGSYWEDPYRYTGRIDAIWVTANGNARVAEMT